MVAVYKDKLLQILIALSATRMSFNICCLSWYCGIEYWLDRQTALILGLGVEAVGFAPPQQSFAAISCRVHVVV